MPDGQPKDLTWERIENYGKEERPLQPIRKIIVKGWPAKWLTQRQASVSGKPMGTSIRSISQGKVGVGVE